MNEVVHFSNNTNPTTQMRVQKSTQLSVCRQVYSGVPALVVCAPSRRWLRWFRWSGGRSRPAERLSTRIFSLLISFLISPHENHDGVRSTEFSLDSLCVELTSSRFCLLISKTSFHPSNPRGNQERRVPAASPRRPSGTAHPRGSGWPSSSAPPRTPVVCTQPKSGKNSAIWQHPCTNKRSRCCEL